MSPLCPQKPNQKHISEKIMPATSTAKFNNLTLTFTEADHKYIDDRGFEYTSVTTFLKRFFEPFNPDAVAARMAEQGKGDADELKAQWKAKGEAACDYGTRVHETAEAALRNEPPPHTPRTEKEKQAFRAVWEYSKKKILPHGKIIGPELMVFNPDWGLAGTIDLPVKLEDGTVMLLDWKTNESIPRTGFNDRKALDPVQHLQDCAWTKYCLQLNVYQQLLVSAGYLPRSTKFRRGILWVNSAFEIEYMEVPDLTEEALNCVLSSLSPVPF